MTPEFTAAWHGAHAAAGRYAAALDAGDTDAVVALFLPDGSAEIEGVARLEGQEELRRGFASWVGPTPQLHLYGNVTLTEWTATSARATSDLVFFKADVGRWHVDRVGSYRDELRLVDGSWLFVTRSTRFAD